MLLHSEDRAQHLYVVGKTGLGKSTLLRNLIVQDIHAGRGVGLLDPHGDLAGEVLELVPRSRANDVVYFNPGDLERPVGLNLLPRVAPDAAHLVVSGVVAAFRGIWGDSWGPRLEYILGHALAALLDYGGLTILALPRLLGDDEFRDKVGRNVKDPVVRAFWQEEYARYERRFRLEAIAPLQNKVGRLLANAPLRNIFGQVRNRFDPAMVMDRCRIFIANLAKGVVGEDAARLLGALLLSQFQCAAMQRERDLGARPPFYLYIDEFQSFATDALTSILAESRKYGLALTIAHQYLDQLPDRIRQSVFGNVGNLVSFRVGQRDAEVLEEEFGGEVKSGNLVSLGKHEIYARLLEHGRAFAPFRGETLPAIRASGTGSAAAVIRRSRERYGRARSEVEGKIERWLAG